MSLCYEFLATNVRKAGLLIDAKSAALAYIRVPSHSNMN